MRNILATGLVAVMAGNAWAQTPSDPRVATPAGHEASVGVGYSNYTEEPGGLRISIHGARIGGEYTGTWLLNERRHWFARAIVRANAGSVRYDGWCRPWLIRPSTTSANGYALGLGSASSCSESGDADAYVEGRGLVGKDLLLRNWALSPHTGLGLRYLSNGTTGVTNFRTDAYLYVPLGVTARTLLSHHALIVSAEFDALLRGWQTTRESKLGGFDVPATAAAPAFTVDAFTDLSFPQERGWGVRAGAKYQVSRRWSIEPSYIHWHVGDSPVRHMTATFTVDGVTAQQQLGAYEPDNVTDEVSVNLGFHF